MEILGHLFAAKHKKQNALPRKNAPIGRRVAIAGAPGCGKTALLLSSAQEQNEPFLYIDLEDSRLDIAAISAALPQFLQENPVSFLAIDNYEASLSLPEFAGTIYLTHTGKPPSGFINSMLFALDFEEFLAHSKTGDPKTSFDEFLRVGGLPEMTHQDDLTRIKRSQERLKLVCETAQKQQIFAWFLKKSAHTLTPHQAYTALKETIAISKNSLYDYLQTLLVRQMLFAVPKLDAPNAPRKFYAYDHALRDAITFDKSLWKTFETMIALEMIKHGRSFTYANGVDIYLQSQARAVIAAPFLTAAQIDDRLARIDPTLKLERIEFVTMGFEFSRNNDRRTIEALPFWEWALKEDE
ncbi:hypothetical protein AGMMS50229_14760 [Campylobacterota bacterium]|nr:hypothetical protein AGMMS50229_14760 [Campylobacterota bacterium]